MITHGNFFWCQSKKHHTYRSGGWMSQNNDYIYDFFGFFGYIQLFEIKFIKLICWCVRSILYQYWYKIGLVLYITMQKIVLYWFNLLNIIDKIFILSYQLCQLKINSWREYFYQVSNSLITEIYNSCVIVVAACGIKKYWFPNQERVI